MALEDQGISINVEKLKAKLKKRYPEYNFDIPAPPDTTCKARAFCSADRQYFIQIHEGNTFCGQRYKQTDKDNPYKWDLDDMSCTCKISRTRR